jgi:hypothetical protein
MCSGRGRCCCCWSDSRTVTEALCVAGVNSPRVAASGPELPSARLISTQFATEVDAPSENYTLLVMQWGQFLDHDLTHTPISRGEFSCGSDFLYLFLYGSF